MLKRQYDKTDLPGLAGRSPIAEIFPFRTVMPALYIAGCNLRCLYCLNCRLVLKECPTLDAYELAMREKNALEPWLMISGAEPLMNPKTPNLLYLLKTLGFNVAVATNGTYYEELKSVVEDGLVDHVAIDVKAPLELERYVEISPAGITSESLARIRASIEFMKNYPLKLVTSCHFRTTVCGKYIDFNDLELIAEHLGGDATYVLQYYTTHQTLDPQLADDNYVVSYETLVDWASRIEGRVKNIFVSEV